MPDPIYHLRCTHCGAAYLSAPGSLRSVCIPCDQVDWQLLEVWLRPRTPWVDAPGKPPRLLPLDTPAGFLARLRRDVTSQDMTVNLQRVRFVVPGLSHQVTWQHAPWCPTHTQDFAWCIDDEQCREVVTYARVAVTGN